MSVLHADNYKFPDIFSVDKVVPKKVWWNITATGNDHLPDLVNLSPFVQTAAIQITS